MTTNYFYFALLLFGSLAAAADGAEPEDYRYRYEVLGTDLNRPMTMEMAYDGRIYFNEIDGKFRVLDPETKVIKDVGTLEVFTQQENGFLGFALDPNFEENGHVFFQHSPKDFKGQAITRFTIKDDRLDMSSPKELLRWPVQRDSCCHHAGEMKFGPDGDLYFSTGDNTSPHRSDGFTPIDERDGRGPYDAQKSAANTNDLRGKINRIRPTPDGSFTIPDGNLFPKGIAKTRPEIYAMGFRNPWRFTVDQETGIVYVGDVGPDSGSSTEERGPNGYDTINQIRKPAYFGWPYSRGNEAYQDYSFESETSAGAFDQAKPVNESPNNTGMTDLPPISSPMIWYARKQSSLFPEVGTGGRTACAGEVFHYKPEFADSDGFPEFYDGSLLWFDWQRPLLLWAMLDSDFTFTKLEKFSSSAQISQGDADKSKGMQFKRPVDVFFGPDGCAYIMDYGETWGKNADAKIVKVSYHRGNLSPTVEMSVELTSGKSPLKTRVSAEGSSDPEGKALSFQWIVMPGEKVVANTEVAEVVIEEPGNYKIELRVSDPDGAVGTLSESVVVGNEAPVVTFTEPEDGHFFEGGDTISYQVRIDDAEDGNSVDGDKAALLKFGTIVTTEWFDQNMEKVDSAVGMTLMKHSGCFNCHAMEEKIVGPPLFAIADKYRGQKGAMDVSADRVLKGSAGVWGEVPMLPHPQHSKDEIFMMVEWIYSLKKGDGGAALHRGTEGVIKVPLSEDVSYGVLKAEFTDSGASPADALTTVTSVKLRKRKVEAEDADEINGPRVAKFKKASGKLALGGIKPGSFIRISSVDLRNVSSIQIRYALQSRASIITIREGAKDGPVIGEISLESTGGWEAFEDAETTIQPIDESVDLYLDFSGAVNLDYLYFKK